MSGDGYPAFPVTPAANQPYTEGMSLRDWFAWLAMAGVITSHTDAGDIVVSTMAEWAYECAEAMLLEHDKPAGGEGTGDDE